jgi:hypothetical protein
VNEFGKSGSERSLLAQLNPRAIAIMLTLRRHSLHVFAIGERIGDPVDQSDRHTSTDAVVRDLIKIGLVMPLRAGYACGVCLSDEGVAWLAGHGLRAESAGPSEVTPGHVGDTDDLPDGDGALKLCRNSVHDGVECAEAHWRSLTDEQRCNLISLCCHSCGGCGKLDPSCRCWDDS